MAHMSTLFKLGLAQEAIGVMDLLENQILVPMAIPAQTVP